MEKQTLEKSGNVRDDDAALDETRVLLKKQPIRAFLLESEETPEKIGSGTITGIIGEGAAAIVYEILYPDLNGKRAIKFWRTNLPHEVSERFEMEAEIASGFTHPNIVKIHSFGRWGDHPYIEMEKVEGTTLKSLLSRRAPFPTSVALAISIMACRALVHAHGLSCRSKGEVRRGIVHRDIKPANILVSQTGVVKVTDFGIAASIDTATPPDAILGSLPYVAPEQLQGGEPDPLNDVFSLAAVLYEMLSGTRAFGETDAAELLETRLINDFAPVADLRPKLPTKLRKLIERGMSASPEERIESSLFLAALEASYARLTELEPQEVVRAFLDYEEIGTHRRPFVRSPLGIAVAASALCLGIAAFAAISHFARSQRPAPFVAAPIPKAPSPSPRVTAQAEVGAPPPQKAPAAARLAREAAPAHAPGPAAHRAVKDRGTASIAPPSGRARSTPAAVVPIVKSRTEIPVGRMQPPVDTVDQALATLQQIRAKFARGDLSGLGSIFAGPALDDGEYYLWMARYLCETGRWQRALSVVEKALAVPARALSGDQLTKEYFFRRAGCLSAAFGAEPVAARATAAMEAWYDVKYQLRGSPRDPRFVQADTELRRISKEVNGK